MTYRIYSNVGHYPIMRYNLCTKVKGSKSLDSFWGAINENILPCLKLKSSLLRFTLQSILSYSLKP